ncbi:hypothetical protein GQ53DRAFT_527720 [Thozetella sp. PMI_491]|nr:hypothetical protein GQ53DRAFT_527720 [Thozetella sp. PMI_491]
MENERRSWCRRGVCRGRIESVSACAAPVFAGDHRTNTKGDKELVSYAPVSGPRGAALVASDFGARWRGRRAICWTLDRDPGFHKSDGAVLSTAPPAAQPTRRIYRSDVSKPARLSILDSWSTKHPLGRLAKGWPSASGDPSSRGMPRSTLVRSGLLNSYLTGRAMNGTPTACGGGLCATALSLLNFVSGSH